MGVVYLTFDTYFAEESPGKSMQDIAGGVVKLGLIMLHVGISQAAVDKGLKDILMDMVLGKVTYPGVRPIALKMLVKDKHVQARAGQAFADLLKIERGINGKA